MPGHKKPKFEIEALRNEIRLLKVIGKSPEEIQKDLNLAKSTYWWHIKEMGKDDRKIIETTRKEMLDSEILYMYRRFYRAINTMECIIADKTSTPKEKIEAEEMKMQFSVDVVRLLRDGPLVLNLPNENFVEELPPPCTDPAEWNAVYDPSCTS